MTICKVGNVVAKRDNGKFWNGVRYATISSIDRIGGKVHYEEVGTLLNDLDGFDERYILVKEVPGPAKTDQDFKADAGKLDWTLLMGGDGLIRTLEGVVRVLDFAVKPKDQGGKGYEPHSWRQVPRAKERYRAALHRHLAAIERGEEIDPESGESHWYHASCCVLFLAELENQDDE